jgi:acetate---CoA ligase (ADP-forming)
MNIQASVIRKEPLSRMLRPQTIAVIGASEKLNYGGRLMRNLIEQGYQGRIYPVHPSGSTILGLPSFSSILDIVGPIDLAIVVVKAEMLDAILQQCEDKQVGAVLIISAGFREQGTDEGEQRERTLKQWSLRTGIPVCGPNCLGIASSAVQMWASSATSIGIEPIPSGSIGLLSHSGATAFGPLLNRGKDYGVGYRYIISTGNETCVTMEQFAEWMLDDPQIQAIGLFIEGIKDGEAFIRLADKALQVSKPIIALKIGESEVGQKAAASHTASLTGNQQVFEALCRQKGVILAKDYDEFLTAAKCFEYGREMAGSRLAVLSHSGGIGGYVGDKLGKAHFQIPELQPNIRQRIDGLLTGFGTSANPLDLSGTMQTELLLQIVEILESGDGLDGYVFATHGNLPLIERLSQINKAYSKPIYLLWTGSQESPLLTEVRKLQIPLFFLPEKLAITLERVQRFYSRRDRSAEAKLAQNRYAQMAAFEVLDWTKLELEGNRILAENEGKQLLPKIGIPVPQSWYIAKGSAAAASIRALSFTNVAKIVSRKIIHKSDHGGVLLNISSYEEAIGFYQNKIVHSAETDSIDGMLLEEMVANKVELILGSTTDPQFGPIVMVGLGGIYTELFQMVNWRVAPIDPAEAHRMLGEIHGVIPYLSGYRNMPVMDIDSLCEAIASFSYWVYEQRDHISSVEINPLAVLPQGEGVCALDCVITLN